MRIPKADGRRQNRLDGLSSHGSSSNFSIFRGNSRATAAPLPACRHYKCCAPPTPLAFVHLGQLGPCLTFNVTSIFAPPSHHQHSHGTSYRSKNGQVTCEKH